MSLAENALAKAVSALYLALPEEQQAEVRRTLYVDAVKRDKDTAREDVALDILEGGWRA